MKKLLIAAMVFAAVACNSSAQKTTTKTKDMKTLVAYFSASGVTRNVAEQLAETCNADLYEITPEKPYTDADLDWTNKESRSSLEMNDLSSRPAIKGTVKDIDQYDVVYIGFPIWWYTAPTIINTFIEANNLKGKTVALFATSGGSSITKACDDMKKKYPDIKWKEGRLLNRFDKADVEQWINE